jgi:hypothetical protein
LELIALGDAVGVGLIQQRITFIQRPTCTISRPTCKNQSANMQNQTANMHNQRPSTSWMQQGIGLHEKTHSANAASTLKIKIVTIFVDGRFASTHDATFAPTHDSVRAQA